MASSYKSLRCDCCAGTLEYNREKKVWICKYCGNEVRREEEYDGLFTIKNVVKQTLMDLSDGRLDGAERNLSECEKIDSRYVGTCLARLAVGLYTVITPGACAEGEVKGIFGRLKRDYDALQAIDSGISTEEEALYESFDGAADAFGVLYLTLDSLGDQVHRDFVEKMMDCGTLYSRSLNEQLLRVFLKSGKTEQVDQILGNSDNIDCRTALLCVLDHYADGEAKRGHITALVEKAGLQPDDRKEIERYLRESQDSPETKRAVYCAAAAAGAPADVDCVADCVLEPAGGDEAAAQEILHAFCSQHPNDQTVYFLLERILTRYSGGVAAAALEELSGQDIFVVMPGKMVTTMLNRADLTAEEKIRLLELCHRFRIDARTDDAILSAYLCGGGTPDERSAVLPALLSYVKTLSTAAMERYVLGCTIDGTEKPQVLQQLLQLDLNKSFFRDLLSDYMKKCPDGDEVRAEVIRLLSEWGLQIDGSMLVDMACGAASQEEMARTLEKALQSGVRLPANGLSAYLERRPRGDYDPIVMTLLHTPGARMSDEALCNYVLYSRDDPSVKVRNAVVFAEQTGRSFGSSLCGVRHLGNTIRCNLLQGYVLTTEDDQQTASQLVNAMTGARTKLNPPIQVGGVSVPFKKYVTERKEQLSPVTLQLCSENRVFTLFF